MIEILFVLFIIFKEIKAKLFLNQIKTKYFDNFKSKIYFYT